MFTVSDTHMHIYTHMGKCDLISSHLQFSKSDSVLFIAARPTPLCVTWHDLCLCLPSWKRSAQHLKAISSGVRLCVRVCILSVANFQESHEAFALSPCVYTQSMCGICDCCSQPYESLPNIGERMSTVSTTVPVEVQIYIRQGANLIQYWNWRPRHRHKSLIRYL